MLAIHRVVSIALCSVANLMIGSGCAPEDGTEPDVVWHECAPIPDDRTDRDLLLRVEALGFCASSAVDLGDAYQVEDDVVLTKASLRAKQASTSSLVSSTNIRNVTVRIDGSIPVGGVDDWRTATQTAIDAWNGVALSPVTLVVTGNATADIVVTADGGALANLTAADAVFPSNGRAGNRVRINLDFNGNQALTESQKVFLMAHELGHCIGFRHTNWQSLGESSAAQIAGTPATDTSSVMNGGTAGNLWGGLSSNDALALRTLYPFIPHLNIEYAGCGPTGVPLFLVDWGDGTINLPVTQWRFERRINNVWTLIHLGNDTSWSFRVGTGGSLSLRVRGNTGEGWSNWRTLSETSPSCDTLPL